MTQLTLSPQFIDRLSSADTQFRDGNFLAAVSLYTGILSDISKHTDVERGDVASVVLKVAECSYAAGDFESARLAYEKLLKLQDDSAQTSNKDRVFTLVKAAKNYEKLDDKANAQKRYEQAYELAKSALPAKHFLRRTVFECYAQWLRAEKADALTLSILESELGLESSAKSGGDTAHAASAESTVGDSAAAVAGAETTAATTETVAKESESKKKDSRDERKTAEDYNDLRAKLGGRKTKPTDAKSSDSQPKSEPADLHEFAPDPLDPLEPLDWKKKGADVFEKNKAEKSIERQIAARKFLNFSTNNNAKADRSKLKTALTDDNAIVSDREAVIGDAKTSDPNLAQVTKKLVDDFDFQEAKKELALEQANQDLLEEAENLLRNLELAQQQKASAPAAKSEPSITDKISDSEFLSPSNAPKKFVPKVDLQHELEIERLLAESARMIYSLENVDPDAVADETDESLFDPDVKLGLKGSRDVAMRGSGRSFFGQEEEKEAPVEVETVSDKIDKLIPRSEKFNKAFKIGVPLVAVAAVLALASIGNTNMKPDTMANAPAYVQPLMDKDFSTADDAVAIAFKPGLVEIRANNAKRKPNVYFWNGTTNDELRLLQGAYRKCVWLRPTKDGLASSDGKVLYRADAPELRLIEVMDSIKTAAMGYFSATGHYPNPEQVQPRQFVNPVSQRYEEVNISNMVVTKDRPAEASERMDIDLENGQHFNNEAAAKPGSISVFCVQVGDPLQTAGTEANTYTESMYIHAYDAKGELLKSGANNKVMLTELKPTGPKSTISRSEVGAFKDCDICITDGEEPSAVGVSFKYIVFTLMVAGLLGFLFWSQKAKNQELAAEAEDQ
ncbi:MAG TPA: tetratricopeptide repeat protein [Drouetiella sp.]